MEKYSKQVIDNTILKAMKMGRTMDDMVDTFLMMKMMNDWEGGSHIALKGPSIREISNQLEGCKELDCKDYGVEFINGVARHYPRLFVNLSPSCSLFVENTNGLVQTFVNAKFGAIMNLYKCTATDLVKWIVRQKQNYESYMTEWNDVVVRLSKKIKGHHIATLAIKAIFTDAMREYDDLKYEFLEQKRRVRIKVNLPKSKVGVYLDAWWGSYKERLPMQIEELKLLIEVHSRTSINNFFISR